MACGFASVAVAAWKAMGVGGREVEEEGGDCQEEVKRALTTAGRRHCGGSAAQGREATKASQRRI